MNCEYCGNPLPDDEEFCPACGASFRKSDKVAEPEPAAAEIEYSDKKLSVFLKKNIVFGMGCFYVGRPRLGALTMFLDVLALLFAVIYMIYALLPSYGDYNHICYDLFAGHGRGHYFRLGLNVFVIVYLSMQIAALFVKTDGDGKVLK